MRFHIMGTLWDTREKNFLFACFTTKEKGQKPKLLTCKFMVG